MKVLLELSIQNLALIESLSLEPHIGFSVFTGESGSGKSVTIEALNLLFGARASAHKVRQGAQKSEINAIFDIQHHAELKHWLSQADLLQSPPHEAECIIRRIIQKDGRTKAYINNTPCTIAQLKQLGSQLFTLISQHQQQTLTQQETLLSLLDKFGGHTDLNLEVLQAKKDWKQLEQQLSEEKQRQAAAAERFALQEYQLAELNQLDLNQYKTLEQRHQTLSHAEHNQTQISQALYILTGQREHNLLSLSHKVLHHLEQVQPIDSGIQECRDFILQIQILLEESEGILKQKLQHIEHNPEELNSVNQSLHSLQALAKKHQQSPEKLSELAHMLQQAVSDYRTQQETLSATTEQCAELAAKFHSLAKRLNKARQACAPQLANALATLVRPLGMQEFRCEFAFSPKTESRIDQCELLMATHNKQACLPLRKIASGGELSRIQLGVSLLNKDHAPPSLMIFDEIDTGVSGKIAENIGAALANLAKQHQVLCITHSPQIAGQSQYHFQVRKCRKQNNLATEITLLSPAEKPKELARMIGSDSTQEENLAFAQAILEANEH